MAATEQAALIDAQVKAGAFASAVERWLRDEAIAAYDRWQANPDGDLSPQEMAERMRRRHAARLKAEA